MSRPLISGMRVQRKVVKTRSSRTPAQVVWKDAVFLKFNDKMNAVICYPDGEVEVLNGTNDMRW